MKLLFLLLLPTLVFANYAHVERVVSVYDGDTFRVDITGYPAIVGENVPIRVSGIDTPEIRGKCYMEKKLAYSARDAARAFLSGGDIVLLNLERGKYFRLVADVEVNGHSLGRHLIDQGLAVPYDGKTKTHRWCGRF